MQEENMMLSCSSIIVRVRGGVAAVRVKRHVIVGHVWTWQQGFVLLILVGWMGEGGGGGGATPIWHA